jgi:hypothetical protein
LIEDIARAQRASLEEWAASYANDSANGAAEVAFLLRRTVKQFDVMLGAAPVEEPPKVEEPRAG